MQGTYFWRARPTVSGSRPDEYCRTTRHEVFQQITKNGARGKGMIMRAAFTFALAVLVSVGAHAQTARVDRIEVVEYGIYRTETTKRTETPGTAGGYVRTLTNIRNSEVTRTVPARPGVRFWFRYNVIGAPD